ncbi:hypothetical protein N9D91_03755 [Planktomarina temperata]|nr:hypothetical protein [Planktomarina temperata]
MDINLKKSFIQIAADGGFEPIPTDAAKPMNVRNRRRHCAARRSTKAFQATERDLKKL